MDDEGDRALDDVAPPWRGAFSPYSVGDPGRAASVEARYDSSAAHRPDTVLDGLEFVDASGIPTVKLRAASVRGRAHRYSGTVRQDSYAYRGNAQYVVAAVADGVSASPLSHLAADLAVDEACRLVLHLLVQQAPASVDWKALLEQLSESIAALACTHLELSSALVGAESPAETRRRATSIMATTLTLLILEPLQVNDHYRATFCSYGDSSAWILREGRRWEPQLGWHGLQEGAISSSATDALPIISSVRTDISLTTDVGLEDVVVLMTDGVGDTLGAGNGTVADFLACKWATPPDPLDFAAQVNFARRSHDDDRTVLAFWPITS